MRRAERQVTDQNQIKQILDNIKTCHLAMIDGERPYVIPLSYGYKLEDDVLSVYFHGAKQGKKIDVLNANANVCFEMSTKGAPSPGKDSCEFGYFYSSLIGFGKAEFVEAFEEKNEALSVIVKHQTGVDESFTQKQADTVVVFKVVTKEFTAKAKV